MLGSQSKREDRIIQLIGDRFLPKIQPLLKDITLLAAENDGLLEQLKNIRSQIESFDAKVSQQLSGEKYIWESEGISDGSRSFCFGRLSLLENLIVKELEELKKTVG